MSLPTGGEQLELRDALYDLQRTGERNGFETEPAVVAGELFGDCAVSLDLRTQNRIVVSRLPDDETNFAGAMVSITNPDGNVRGVIHGRAVSRPEFIISVDEDLTTRQLSWGKDGRLRPRPIPLGDVLQMVTVPYINPVPISESDPREAPAPTHYTPWDVITDRGIMDIDSLPVPRADVYTSCTTVYDAETRHGTNIITADLQGLMPGSEVLEIPPFGYRVRIIETSPQKLAGPVSDFDRTFLVTVDTDTPIALPFVALGGREGKLVHNQFLFEVMREGVVLKRTPGADRRYPNRSRTQVLIAKPETVGLFNSLLEFAQPIAQS